MSSYISGNRENNARPELSNLTMEYLMKNTSSNYKNEEKK